MRILHVTNMYPDEDRPYWGAFIKSQVEALRGLGVECTVHLVDGQASRLNYIRHIRTVRLHAASSRFDLMHAHYGLTGLTAAWQSSLPIVLSLYGSDVNVQWQCWVSRIAEQRAKRTIVCSRRMGIRLRAAREPLILPPGVDTGLFRPRDRRSARKRFGIAPGATALLFPANPARPVKNFPLFEAAVTNLQIENVHILTLGDITNEDLPYLYSAADCVVLTSISEGSPTVIKEARACGCPVVSVDVGDVAEQLEGYPYGMVTKTRDPEEIAKRVAQMLVEQRPQPTSADLEKLSIETTGKRLLGVYRSVLGY